MPAARPNAEWRRIIGEWNIGDYVIEELHGRAVYSGAKAVRIR